MSEIRVELEPDGTCVTVRVRSGSEELEFIASYLIYWVTDLVYAALELTEFRETRPIIFPDEPGAWRLSMTGNGDIVQVTITKHDYLAPNAYNGRVVFSAEVPRTSLAKAIWSAVQQLEVTSGLRRSKAEWPAKELKQLAERVA